MSTLSDALAAMGKATKGPWAVNPVHATVDAFDSGKPLAVCGMLWPTTERTEDQTEANAALIAAAPDMVAWIKKALPWLEKHRENLLLLSEINSEINKGGVNVFTEPLATLDALLAEAKGDK